ncbi:flagellar hook-length control protein FliK [Dongia sp.]|uniref:flagellar hook-length control protein FliK n=1 Tax=Dongia sp. TaxID=1977262 RepID=UPI0035B265BB
MLMGVMNHHLTQAEPTTTKASTAYTPRRRFDDYPNNRVDYRDAGGTHVDRRVQNDQSSSRWSIGDDSANPARGIVHRASGVGNVAGRVDCGQVAGQEVDIGDVPTEPAEGVEGAPSEQSIDAPIGENMNPDGAQTDAEGDPAPDQSTQSVPTPSPIVAAVPVETVEDGTDVAPAVAASDSSPSVPVGSSGDAVGEVTPLIEPDSASASAPQAAPNAAGDEDATVDPDAAKAPVTFTSTLALGSTGDEAATAAQSQVDAATRKNERELEEAAGSFRRNTNARRAGPAGQGATATNSSSNQQQAAQNSEIHVAASVNSSAAATPMATTYNTATFDGGLGSVTGVPGWNLHLAQGSAIRRTDFVANLRQHLQNLPVHDQVALSIQKSAKEGVGSITLQLSPSELGRIHLKLEIDEENNVQAAVTVERPATLDLLQRDMKALERALQEAGLKAGPGDLSFSLQGGDPEAFARDFGSGNGSGSGGNGMADGSSAETEADIAPSSVIATNDGYVDVQV